MTNTFGHYTKILSVIGDILCVRVPFKPDGGLPTIRLGDLAIVKESNGHSSLAQTIKIIKEKVFLQVFSGTRGFSNHSQVIFLGHPMQVTYSQNIIGRIFNGAGDAIDGGPDLDVDPKVSIGGPPVNPLCRVLASKMIRTDIPMIDLFNCLVESQKIPIFSVSGEPYNPLLARIGVQADVDIVIFGGLGLTFDDFFNFQTTFQDAGLLARTILFCNLASDPVIERLLIPDLALTVAERFAVEEGKRVLVLLTDMTAFADALKEVGIALEQVPSNRGYMGDLYSQLARRYEKACDFSGAGSVTILTVTTMPGNDLTHPVPDNTGYITEGQFYLHDGVIDPFGSLSRLKQHVIGHQTREDHGQIMNTMIRLYSEAISAQQKKAMAFTLSDYDQRLLKFGDMFRQNFMKLNVSMSLEKALDSSWQTLAECFKPSELLMKQYLIEKYFPKQSVKNV